MLVGLTMTAQTHYVSALDPAKGTPEATTFLLGSIDRATMARIMDKALVFKQGDGDEAGASQVRMNEVNYELVRHGLKGWTNFKDADGNDIPLETVADASIGRLRQVVSHASMDRLSMDLISDIAREVNRINSLTKEQAKN